MFGITLRRERVPQSGEAAEASPSSAYVQYRTSKVRRLKAATLNRVVDHLLDPCCQEPDYGRILLSTHRTFISTNKLIELLFQRCVCLHTERMWCAWVSQCLSEICICMWDCLASCWSIWRSCFCSYLYLSWYFPLELHGTLCTVSILFRQRLFLEELWANSHFSGNADNTASTSLFRDPILVCIKPLLSALYSEQTHSTQSQRLSSKFCLNLLWKKVKGLTKRTQIAKISLAVGNAIRYNTTIQFKQYRICIVPFLIARIMCLSCHLDTHYMCYVCLNQFIH